MAILKGELPLGASISRRHLAVQLGMSMVPVGEALQRLEADGLVESRPRSGTVVRRLHAIRKASGRATRPFPPYGR